MNKPQLIDAITNYTSVNKKDVGLVLDGLASALQQKLFEGEEVTLPGIGKLRISERAARQGRNPKTGEAIQIAATTTVKFSAAKALKDAVNS